jgi:hypothetical protein
LALKDPLVLLELENQYPGISATSKGIIWKKSEASRSGNQKSVVVLVNCGTEKSRWFLEEVCEDLVTGPSSFLQTKNLNFARSTIGCRT